MPDELTLEQAQARIRELEGQVTLSDASLKTTQESLASLQTIHKTLGEADTAKGVELAKLTSSAATHTSALEALQGKLTAAEQLTAANTDAVTQLATLTEKHTALETKVQQGVMSRLQGLGLKEETLKDKTLDVLEIMEVAALAARPATPPGTADPTGLGLPGGGSSTPSNAEGMQADLDTIAAAKKAVGVPV
tara:strand:+ start:2184 stop:2762 length:579 start_codon:yes stop_codon:yes gene_type:complete